MKTITLKQLETVLDDALSKGTPDKPYSVLFVSEADIGFRSTIESWLNKRPERQFVRDPSWYYTTTKDGFMKKTDHYVYDSSIEGAEILFRNANYTWGEEMKAKEHELLSNMINNKGFVINDKDTKLVVKDEELKLVVVHVLTPLWVSGVPVFGVEDHDLFDEIIFIEANVEVFKEYFIGKTDSRIEEFSSSDSEEDRRYAELLKELKEIALFFLCHPKFHFIPIEKGETPDSLKRVKSESLTPYDMEHKVLYVLNDEGKALDQVSNHLRDEFANIAPKAKQLLLDILDDYNAAGSQQ